MDAKTQLTDRQIAVLIDLENVGLSSIQWLFDQISDIGRIIVKRAYADWSIEASKKDQLLELGIEAIPLVRSTSGGKNASDIRLAIDAVDLQFTSPVDTFVIVSSDSDFVPLISKLRSAGKTVLGAGEEKKVPKTLVKSCDRYFYLDEDRSIRKSKRKKSTVKLKETESLIRRAVEASIDEHGKVLGSKLHQMILRLDPSFDYSLYGYSTFTKFLEASSILKLNRPDGPVILPLNFRNKPLLRLQFISSIMPKSLTLNSSNKSSSPVSGGNFYFISHKATTTPLSGC